MTPEDGRFWRDASKYRSFIPHL